MKQCGPQCPQVCQIAFYNVVSSTSIWPIDPIPEQFMQNTSMVGHMNLDLIQNFSMIQGSMEYMKERIQQRSWLEII